MWNSKLVVLSAAIVLSAGPAFAEWPEDRVNIVVPASVGTSLDTAARAVAEKLSEKWGQPVTVENKVGAGGVVGTEYLLSLPADGYNLLLGAPTYYTAPYIYPDVKYDPLEDAIPTARVGAAHLVMVVGKNSSFATLDALLEEAKTKPGELTFAMTGNGSFTNFCPVLLQNLTDTEMLAVAYKDSGMTMTDLLAGRVNMAFTGIATAIGQIQSGDMVAIATTGTTRTSSLSDVPTFQELGVSGYECTSWSQFFAKTGTANEIIEKISTDVGDVMSDPDMQKYLQSLGVEPNYVPADQLIPAAAAEQAKFKKIVEQSGAAKK